MAKRDPSGLLPPLERREVVFAVDADLAELGRLGRAYLEAGRTADALDFFDRARDVEGLEKIVRLARESGDTFFFERAVRALGREPDAAEWKELGDIAAARGKEVFAYQAHMRAGIDVRRPTIEPVTPALRAAPLMVPVAADSSGALLPAPDGDGGDGPLGEPDGGPPIDSSGRPS